MSSGAVHENTGSAIIRRVTIGWRFVSISRGPARARTGFPLRTVYSALYTLALLALAPRALWHRVMGGRYAVALGARLGVVPPALEGLSRSAIWIHAVSVGEVRAARGLIPHLRRQLPASPIVLSTTTPTGQAMAEQAGADACFYMPVDLPFALAPYFQTLRPHSLLLVETEIWPNLLRACTERDVPVVLINGRLSERSRRRYQWLARWWREPLDALALVCARTAIEARRFRRLGIASDRVLTTGNLKADAATAVPAARDRERLAHATALNGAQRLLVAGCTMQGEEDQVLRAFARVRAAHPDVRLLLAPRHPERFDEVERLVEEHGFACARRSAPPRDAEVILLDTIGELPAAYGLGVASFVGGSLVRSGGHNLMEPAVVGQPVVFGPHVDNFAALAQALETAGGAFVVGDAAALADTWKALLDDPDERRRIGDVARSVVLGDSASGRRTARLIAQHLRPA